MSLILCFPAAVENAASVGACGVSGGEITCDEEAPTEADLTRGESIPVWGGGVVEPEVGAGCVDDVVEGNAIEKEVVEFEAEVIEEPVTVDVTPDWIWAFSLDFSDTVWTSNSNLLLA